MHPIVPALVIASGISAAGLLAAAGVAPMRQAKPAPRAVHAEGTTLYTVDTVHSTILFKIRHGGVANFYGQFTGFSGSVGHHPDDFTKSSIEFEVKIDSVNTNNKGRDDHLRNADFFNARQYPTASFKSTEITEGSAGNYILKGDLTLYGQTKPIVAELVDVSTGSVRGKGALGFEARFPITRTEWGMTKYVADDGTDNGPLGNTVTVIVAVEALAG